MLITDFENNPDLVYPSKIVSKLTVLRCVKSDDDLSKELWLAECVCKNKVLVSAERLLTEKKLSCGCAKNKLLNKRYGELTILSMTGYNDESKDIMYECYCNNCKDTVKMTFRDIEKKCSCGCLNDR